MNLSILKARIATSRDFSPEDVTFLLDAVDHASTSPQQGSATVLYGPPNYLCRIEHIWAFLSVDKHAEGLCAAPIGGMTVPLIAADEARLDGLRPLAHAVANVFSKPIRLVKFVGRRELEVIEPVTRGKMVRQSERYVDDPFTAASATAVP